MSSSSSPGWERPGGAVDAESFPFRRKRIHYLCPEVTIWTCEYLNSFVLQTASNRLFLLGFQFKLNWSGIRVSALGLTYLAYVDLLYRTSYVISSNSTNRHSFICHAAYKDKSLYSFNSQRAHSMNKVFLFCGTCTQRVSWGRRGCPFRVSSLRR